MPLKKIADPPPRPCLHPEHNFPSMIVLDPGTYEYTCPGCGASRIVRVTGPSCTTLHV